MVIFKALPSDRNKTQEKKNRILLRNSWSHSWTKLFVIPEYEDPSYCSLVIIWRLLKVPEIYGVNLRIQFECGKIGTRKTSNTLTFCAVLANMWQCLEGLNGAKDKSCY